MISQKLSPDTGKCLIQTCWNLVTLDANDGTVQLAHYTVQQFLTDQGSDRRPSSFLFERTQAEQYVGKICVMYLSSPTFEGTISIPGSSQQFQTTGILGAVGP
ncbi:MAG: hypothetical protein M1834_009572, partial [Cirrosporium novae-zelandiae]